MLRRYGPIALVVVVIIGVIAIVGALNSGDDDDSGVSAGDSNGNAAALPLTYQEAQKDGKEGDIDWGPGCDTDTGRLKIPIHNAPPCIEPYDRSKGNGGATSQGVTADKIVVALYKGEPDPLQQQLVEGAGADTDPNQVNQTYIDYLKMLEDVVETYGRTLDIRTIEASGGPADATAALADAQKVIDLKPFAAVGGPTQTPAYWQELTAAKIICVGACSVAEGQENVEKNAPYLWPTGPTPEQADAHLIELLGKQLVGKNAEFAGDPALQSKERVFGWVQAETETDEYKARNDAFEQKFKDEYDGEIAARSTYLFDPGNAATIASSVISRMKEAGVTTVILSVDPLIPAQITEEATKQNYFPEWVVGPSVLADTTIFGRTYDQRQWAHAMGLSLGPARADRTLTDSYIGYQWYYGKEVPVNSQAVLLPGPQTLLTGIELAGPNLTPETFKEGLFRFPPQSGGITSTYNSWGTKLWPDPDYNSADDATAMWWDPEATGKSETGKEGVGMVSYVDGGKRFLPGDWPTDPLPFFQQEGSVTVYDKRPDAVPDYPPWPGSPAAQG
jgi:hypothetical protein